MNPITMFLFLINESNSILKCITFKPTRWCEEEVTFSCSPVILYFTLGNSDRKDIKLI